jgi:hypothetical protein
MIWMAFSVVLLLAFLGLVLGWMQIRGIAGELVNENADAQVWRRLRRPPVLQPPMQRRLLDDLTAEVKRPGLSREAVLPPRRAA